MGGEYIVVIIESTPDAYIVECGRCDGRGRDTWNTEVCSTCGGTGRKKLDIPSSWECNTGVTKCGRCDGGGRDTWNKEVCSTCDGAGALVRCFPRVDCGRCEGNGREPGDKSVCGTCAGVGSVWVGEL